MYRFKVVILEDEFYVDEFVSNHIINLIKLVDKPVIIFDKDDTFEGTYEKLILANKNGEISFHNVKTFTIAQYLYGTVDEFKNISRWLRMNLFSKVNIKEKNIIELNGLAEYFEDECIRYEELLKKSLINLQILSISDDGKISNGDKLLHYNGEDSFQGIEHKPIIVGNSTLTKSKQIVVVAKGSNKAKAVKEMIQGKITESIPATMLRKHNDVIVVLDKEAASELNGFYRR